MFRKIAFPLLFSVSFLLLFSCVAHNSKEARYKSDANTLEVKNYKSYLMEKENGLVLANIDSLLVLTATYLPTDLLAINSIEEDSLTKQKFERQKQIFKDQISFMIEVVSKNESTISSEFIYYFSYKIGNDVVLKSGSLVQKCFSSQYVHSPVKSIPDRLFFDFEASQLNEDLILEIRGNAPSVKSYVWTFKKNDIARIPGLKI